MYLLQEYNSMEYEKFLFLVKNYIFCCCRTAIFDSMIVGNNNNQLNLEKHIQNTNDVTMYETHDISADHAKITIKPLECSVDSTAGQ